MKIERTRLVRRRGGRRDARLFVIAAEGSVTEKQYFEGLRERGIIDRRRVIIEVIDAGERSTRSAPQDVLARLDAFRDRFRLNHALDQLWLVIDLDHWSARNHLRNLTQVVREVRQKGYFAAVSNPCFELWLLLHFTADLDDIRALETPHEACRKCRERIRQLCGSYDKSRLKLDRYTRACVEAAITRADELDAHRDDRWPRAAGTHVYKLAAELLQQRQRNAFPAPDM